MNYKNIKMSLMFTLILGLNTTQAAEKKPTPPVPTQHSPWSQFFSSAGITIGTGGYFVGSGFSSRQEYTRTNDNSNYRWYYHAASLGVSAAGAALATHPKVMPQTCDNYLSALLIGGSTLAAQEGIRALSTPNYSFNWNHIAMNVAASLVGIVLSRRVAPLITSPYNQTQQEVIKVNNSSCGIRENISNTAQKQKSTTSTTTSEQKSTQPVKRSSFSDLQSSYGVKIDFKLSSEE